MKQRSTLSSDSVFPRGIRSIHAPTSFPTGLSIVMSFLFSANLSAAADGGASLFHIGDRVQTVVQTPVWVTPPFAGHFAGNQPPNTLGSLTEGPVRAGEVWWWKVDFDTDPDGWIAERQIRNLSRQTAGSDLNAIV